jgi:hypothetical protein
MEVETRTERLRNSLEYEILMIIKNILMDPDGEWLETNPVLIETPDKRPVIPASLILEKLNESRPTDKAISARAAGSILHKLGVKPARVTNNENRKIRGYLCEKTLFSRLFENYVLIETSKTESETLKDLRLDQIGPDTYRVLPSNKLDTDPATYPVQSGPEKTSLVSAGTRKADDSDDREYTAISRKLRSVVPHEPRLRP